LRIRLRYRLVGDPAIALGGAVLAGLLLIAIAAPLLAPDDPMTLRVTARLRPPSERWWFGTDMVGRDVFTRTVHGARTSLVVGACVAAAAVSIGLFAGLASGYFRAVDAVVMRLMDGVMAMPAILVAVALITLSGATLATVVVAIAIPEIPRVTRLVRSVALTVREEPFVEAAVALGTPPPLVLWRHILPNTLPALTVQATYIAASAILLEAILSFVGAGLPPTIPSWGNIMADGRSYFQLAPWIIFFPGSVLAVLVLGVNMLGDGLRDQLDPRLAKRL